VTSTVQRVKPGSRDSRCVSDVMQPTSDFDKLSLGAQYLGKFARSGGNPLGMRPAPGQLLSEQALSQRLRLHCADHIFDTTCD
jgi:hypothetical protein